VEIQPPKQKSTKSQLKPCLKNGTISEKALTSVSMLAPPRLLPLPLLDSDGGVHDNAKPVAFNVPWMSLPRVVQSLHKWKTRRLNGDKANGGNKATTGFPSGFFSEPWRSSVTRVVMQVLVTGLDVDVNYDSLYIINR
jgi:hypothetical protein